MSERLSIGMVALVLVLAATIGPTDSAEDAFVGWARHDLRLSDDAAACVSRQLPPGALGTDSSNPRTRDRIARQGLDAVDIDHRQLLGDIVVACVLLTGPTR